MKFITRNKAMFIFAALNQLKVMTHHNFWASFTVNIKDTTDIFY